MPRTLSVDVANAIAAGRVLPALIVSIETASGTVRMWNGAGDLTFGANVYAGVGTLLGVSAIEETSDLQATGVRFTLSGVPTAMLSAALSALRINLPARAWLGFFDPDTRALLADPVLLFSGLTDQPEINEAGDTCTIGVAAESRLAILQRSNQRRYTTEDQKLVDADDLGFDYVASLQDKEIVVGAG